MVWLVAYAVFETDVSNTVWVLVRGGLGNQMFQVAYATELSRRFNLTPRYADLCARARVARRWELHCFSISPSDPGRITRDALLASVAVSNKLTKWGSRPLPGVLVEGVQNFMHVGSTAPPRVISGYWQRPSLFSSCRCHITQLFQFPSTPVGIAVRGDVANLGTALVAIHVRRGDYVSDPRARAVHLVCDVEYYRRAWTEIQERVGPCKAWIFSDDPAWVKANLGLGGDICYAQDGQGLPSWVDMARMSTCDHFILSNSTYCWWAAYLGRLPTKCVVAPRRWFRGVDTAQLGICPEDWVLV